MFMFYILISSSNFNLIDRELMLVEISMRIIMNLANYNIQGQTFISIGDAFYMK